MRSGVLLPQPLAPTRLTNSPGATVRLTPASARTAPAPRPKLLLTPATVMQGRVSPPDGVDAVEPTVRRRAAAVAVLLPVVIVDIYQYHHPYASSGGVLRRLARFGGLTGDGWC